MPCRCVCRLAVLCWNHFEDSGFAIVERVLSPRMVDELLEATRTYSAGGHDGVLDRGGLVYGGRDLLWRVPRVLRLAWSPEILSLAQSILGAKRVSGSRAFLRQDAGDELEPSVASRSDDCRFVASRCRPDSVRGLARRGFRTLMHRRSSLARMVTIRLHLDDSGPGDGPLRVLPGSHREGRLSGPAVAEWAGRAGALAVDCNVNAGGAVVMRPLLLHASASRRSAGHRRVIHLEYAAEDLPGGLEWYRPADWAAPVCGPIRVGA